MTKNLTTALFPVAGIGRRLLPMTKSVPKELLPIGGLPLIQHAVNEAKASGITKFVFVAGDNLPQLKGYFSPNPKLESKLMESEAVAELKILAELILDEAIYVRQENPLGLGHAIGCGRDKINEPFAVILPDDLLRGKESPVLLQMKQEWQNLEGSNNMIALENVTLAETSRYGIMSPKKQNGNLVEAENIIEKPKNNPPSTLALIGRYILTPDIFEAISETSSGAIGEIQITDAIALAMKQKNTPLYGWLYEGERFDCGTTKALIKTQRVF